MSLVTVVLGTAGVSASSVLGPMDMSESDEELAGGGNELPQKVSDENI